MIFSSTLFVFCFFPAVTAVYYLMKPLPITVRNTWLFFASLFFYAWGEPIFVLVMLLSIVLNYGLGIAVECSKKTGTKKAFLILALSINLCLLFIFKYLNFSISAINRFFGELLPQTNITLPIGISFFTFQAISYIVDVYRGKSRAQKNPLNVGLYIAFFPQLIAGPIVRYDTIAQQIQERKETLPLFAEGIQRFLRGFCKKVLLSNILGIMADEIFSRVYYEGRIGASLAWLGIVSYTLQIFFDFSGYSDMAIGLGKMYGFTFEENFNYPYIASSVTDFWRRWHISLSRWFRDYVYIPLGGSRVKGKGRLLFNLFVVWTLTGIWHGANWTFIFWGLWYFVLLSFEKLTDLPFRLKSLPLRVVYRIFTLLSVMIGWVFFRSPSLTRAVIYLKNMFLLNGNSGFDPQTYQYLHENGLFLIIALLLSTPALEWLQKKFLSGEKACAAFAVIRPVVYIFLFMYATSFLIIDFYNPFIYFNF